MLYISHPILLSDGRSNLNMSGLSILNDLRNDERTKANPETHYSTHYSTHTLSSFLKMWVQLFNPCRQYHLTIYNDIAVTMHGFKLPFITSAYIPELSVPYRNQVPVPRLRPVVGYSNLCPLSTPVEPGSGRKAV